MNYPHASTETGVGYAVRNELTSVDDLLPDIVHYLPSCNEEVTIRKSLATVIQNFCRETHVFEHNAKAIAVVDDQQYYSIPIPYDAMLLTVFDVERQYYESDGTTLQDNGTVLDRRQYSVEDDLQRGDYRIRFYTPLSADDNNASVLNIRMSLIPEFDPMFGKGSCSLPDKLMKRWRQAFVSGAVFELASMRDVKWSNPTLAQYHMTIWQNAHSEAYDKARCSMMITNGGSARNRENWI